MFFSTGTRVMNYEQISTTLKDNILTLTLNRPEK